MKNMSKFQLIYKAVLSVYEFDCPLLLLGLCQGCDLCSPGDPHLRLAVMKLLLCKPCSQTEVSGCFRKCGLMQQ